MSGNDWIHTRRGVTLVEGTLPQLSRRIERLAEATEGGNKPHPYVGLQGLLQRGGRAPAAGTIVQVVSLSIVLLCEDGSHASGDISNLVLEDPEEAKKRFTTFAAALRGDL
jgi:hypothetical protein